MPRPTANKIRLDVLLHERGLVDSRERGRRLIIAGEVLVDGQLIFKPGTHVSAGAQIDLKQKPRFVSRGGEKLSAALERFALDPAGWVCADVGASTGGFTDCLLQAGAAQVYAVDVGYGQLDWSLRQDERVIVMERVNARHLEALPERVDFVSIDVSFISLRLIFPVLPGWLKPGGQVVALVKPQFEAGRADVGKGGVVKDPDIHRRVLRDVAESALENGLFPKGFIPSPIKGPAGNVEFLLWLDPVSGLPTADFSVMIGEVVEEAHRLLLG